MAGWWLNLFGWAAIAAAYLIVFRVLVGGGRFAMPQRETGYASAVGLLVIGHVVSATMTFYNLFMLFAAAGLLLMIGLRGTSDQRGSPDVL